MGKSAAWLALSFIFLSAVTSFSCNNSIDDMLGEYNEGFNWGYISISDKQEESTVVLEPDDSGFDQSTLLFDFYTVFDIGTLNLSAPASCQSYHWAVTDPSAEDPDAFVPVIYFNETIAEDVHREKDFVVNIPKSGLETPHTYVLTLTVRGKKGGIYKDSAQLFIVEYEYDITD